MRSPAAATISATFASLVMSATSVTMSAPSCSPANSSRRSCDTSTATTRPPSRAMRDAVARPMPEPAPVTMTVLPLKRPWSRRSTHSGRSTSGVALGRVGCWPLGGRSDIRRASGTSPAAARATRSSTICWLNWPLLSFTSRLIARRCTGFSTSAFWPAWASMSRMIGPPTGVLEPGLDRVVAGEGLGGAHASASFSSSLVRRCGGSVDDGCPGRVLSRRGSRTRRPVRWSSRGRGRCGPSRRRWCCPRRRGRR